MHDRASGVAGLTTIAVERAPTQSSSDLIRMVAAPADGRETIASVWNGPRSGFADHTGKYFAEYGSKVQFVPLPNNLPCDLLVATRKVDQRVKDAITAKLQESRSLGREASGSDVDTWVEWSSVQAEDARLALSDLRRQAGASTLPVVVDVLSHQSSRVGGDLLDAARLAIRLAGTELVDRSQSLRLLQEERHPMGTGEHSRRGSPAHGALRELPAGQRGGDAAVRRELPRGFRF